jgi:hypothetical protein
LTVSPSIAAFGTVHPNRQLRPRIVLGDAHIGDAGRVLHHANRLLLDAARIVNLVAANLEREACVLTAAQESD